jgi:hypothetical protein
MPPGVAADFDFRPDGNTFSEYPKAIGAACVSSGFEAVVRLLHGVAFCHGSTVIVKTQDDTTFMEISHASGTDS